VRVVALAEPCAAWGSPHNPLGCPRPAPVLVDPAGTDLADPLPLTVGPSNPLLAFVRRVPVLGGLAPAPQAVHWEVVATYRVRLGAMPHRLCGTTPCYEARLLDAAP
jgi:hypothetical protein